MENFPLELLRLVFHEYLTLQGVPNTQVCHSLETFTKPALLTHVCCFWRDVAYNDPRLFSSMFVVDPTRKMLHLRVRLWLKRAGNFESESILPATHDEHPDAVDEIAVITQAINGNLLGETTFLGPHRFLFFAARSNNQTTSRDQRYHLAKYLAVPIFAALICPRLEFFSTELNAGIPDSNPASLRLLHRSKCHLHTREEINIGFYNLSMAMLDSS